MERDEILYRRFLNERDNEALRVLIERHREGLTLFIFGYIKNMEDAEEIMLEAFAVAASGTARFKGNSSFKTWLFSIGRNLAIRQIRKNKISVVPIHDELTEDVSNPELDIIGKERNRELYRALNNINPDYRQILYLKYFEDMEYEDISLVTGKNKKQVYNLIARGKTALREELEKAGFNY